MGHEGIQLVGMTKAFTDKTVSFNDDLVDNIVSAEQSYLDNLEEMDRYIESNGLELPEEPEAKILMDMPDAMKNPIHELDFDKDHITSIIWASGFGYNYNWLPFDIFQENGAPIHNRGVTSESGIYFVGLPYLSGKGSSFIWGVWHDAKRIAEYIDIQRHYQRYQSSKKTE